MIGPDAAYFDRVARFSSTPRYAAEAEVLLSALALAPGQAVLDIGCGTGTLLARIEERGLRAVGVDAHDSWRTRPPAEEVVRAGAHALPFPTGCFDGVVLMHALAHLAAPGRALAEAARVLRPGGRLGLVTPNRRFLDAMQGLAALFHRYVPDPTVERHLDRDELSGLLAAAGLRTLLLRPFGKRPWPAPRAARRERLLAIAQKPA